MKSRLITLLFCNISSYLKPCVRFTFCIVQTARLKAIQVLLGIAYAFTTTAWAAGGYVYDAVGEVSIVEGKNAKQSVIKNDLIPAGKIINTGEKSYAVLKFDDGQVVAMQANTTFHVRAYRYDPKSPEKSNIIFSKFTGGMRFITGSVGQINNKAFHLTTPSATIGLRGTGAAEFMVSTLNNTLYTRVTSGSISMTNDAGTSAFSAGQTSLVTSPNSLPIEIPASALPLGIFSQLEAIPTPPGIVAERTAIAAGSLATANASSLTLPPAPPITDLLASTLESVPLPTEPLGPAPVAAVPQPISMARTVSITGAGEVYTGADPLCDFCTGRTNTVATHTTPDANTKSGNPVTGEADLFGKHNLTPTGANTGEICAFCHTPQGSESSVAAAPLWNRKSPPQSAYRAYSSLGSAVAEATGSVSMSCLSCHDGTQAPNIVINTPSNQLDLQNDEIINTGNALKNHHPVGMPYGGGGQNQNAPDVPTDPIASYNKLASFNWYANMGNQFTFFNRRGAVNTSDAAAFGDVGNFSNAGVFNREDFNKSTYSGNSSGTVWWVDTPGSKKGRQKNDLYLFTRTDPVDSIPGETTLSQPYVECATCHDPHSSNSTFLRLSGGNARSQVCLTCHNK